MMNNNVNIHWYSWLISTLKEFFAEAKKQFPYEVVDIKRCKATDTVSAVIKLSGRHIVERSLADIVSDDSLVMGLDPFAIRVLTYLATVDQMKPDYSIAVQQFGHDVDAYILKIKSKFKDELEEKTASEISKNNVLIKKFNPVDANRIGYMAGVQDTVNEFKLKESISKH